MRIWVIALLCTIGVRAGERSPMTVNFKNSASYRWLNKVVLVSDGPITQLSGPE